MFSLLGFKNVVGKGAGPMVPLKEEEALSYEPDLIVFVSGMGGGDETKVLMEKEFAARPFYWNEFRAVKTVSWSIYHAALLFLAALKKWNRSKTL